MATTVPYVLFIFVVVAIVVILPVTLNVGSRRVNSTVTPSMPPMGNETMAPFGALSIGIRDNFTQRVCHSIGPALEPRATNERTISNTAFIHGGIDPDPRGMNTFAWAFGQFIDHDIILSLDDETLLGDSIEMLPEAPGTFIDLKRVQRRAPTGDMLGIETFNALSAHIDASTVYGDYKNADRITALRDGGGTACRMIMGPGGTPKYLPAENSFYCGDVRCAEHVVLSSLHALFLREHNRWCSHLDSNPFTTSWTEEQKFWKARSLNIAVIQHITYEEWLPSLFGSQKGLLYSGIPLKGEYTRIATEFGVAAFRFGHSMVANNLGELPLASLFFDANQTISLGVDSILLRAIQTHAETCDNKVVDGLRNFLFSTDHVSIGEDLTVRNMYRARELHLCSYQDMCACYGTTPQNYPANGNTDPILGLLSESLVPDSSLPPTLARIIAEQFRRLKENDEAYYTNTAVSQLTTSELLLVRKSTLKQVLLRNTLLTDEMIPKNAFFL